VQIEHTKRKKERKKEKQRKNNRYTLIDKSYFFFYSSWSNRSRKIEVKNHHREGCIEDEDGLSKFSLGDVKELTTDVDNFESLVNPLV
jgi:hypothetical protein